MAAGARQHAFRFVFIVSRLFWVSALCPDTYNVNLYEEMNCFPEFNDDSTCATSYDCSNFMTLSANHCPYQDQIIEIGDSLEHSPSHGCLNHCVCAEDGFQCRLTQCSKTQLRLPAGCVDLYEKDGCCPTGYACGTNATIQIHKHNNRHYYTNQRFFKSCSMCQFLNVLDQQPYCHSMPCGVSLIASSSLIAWCAPVYHTNLPCCPIRFECPEEDNFNFQIIPSGQDVSGRRSVKMCRFGRRYLRFGDSMLSHNGRVKCHCHLPPFLTCYDSSNSYQTVEKIRKLERFYE